DDVVGDMPVAGLVDDCPLYDLAPEPPAGGPGYPAGEAVLGQTGAAETLLALLGSANVASRLPLFEQYDCLVQSRTVRRPDQADAAVLALPGGGAIGVSIDGNGRRVACDPERGAAEAVLESVANLACVGADADGLTNCLNFGNPEKPRIAWQLQRAVQGLATACEELSLPVVGGNVSLYNEGPDGPIYPTPVVGVVGRIPDAVRAGRAGFATEGDAVAVVGGFGPSLRGSELAKLRGEAPAGPLPAIDFDAVRAAPAAVREAVRAGTLSSAHDVAEGGIAVALAECCVLGGIGAEVAWPEDETVLFGEAPGRAFVVSGPDGAIAAIPGAKRIGRVGGDRLRVGSLDVAVETLREARDGGLAHAFA
ncbi:MAG TPA: AIR synthase related protein, partial [Solirubrobacteraceae bacterium]